MRGWLLCYAERFGRIVPRMTLLVRLAKLAFFAALAFTFYSAVIPPQQAVQLVPWDKAEHFIAFYGLTGLAAAAFPKRHILIIGALLFLPVAALGPVAEHLGPIPFGG